MTDLVLQSCMDEVGMADFVPSGPAYRCDRSSLLIALGDLRALPASFFDCQRDRITRLLDGMRAGASIPPVMIATRPAHGRVVDVLLDGHHRFYISAALGFTHVPALRAP